MINLFRPLFLVSTRPHRISHLTFLFYSLDLLHKVTYIFGASACLVVLPSYTAFVSSFCSSSQDFDTHFLYFHLTMDSLCFSMWLAIYTSTTDFHRLVKRHACRTKKKKTNSKVSLIGGQGWIRTIVRSRGQIYSLVPLTTRPPAQILN